MNEDNIFFTQPVNEQNTGIRIDKYITDCCGEFSRAQVQRLIDDGMVFIDEKNTVTKKTKTKLGDVYKITLPPPIEAEPLPENIPLDILYEDEDLIVINKPAGMTVHPAAGAHSGTLVNALLFHCKSSLSGIGGVARPGIVHRIDRFTSGILVVAKNDLTHRGLAEQFSDHTIERTYFAIVYGLPNPTKGVISGNIARSPYDRKKMAIVQNGGKTAVTHYETVENYKNACSLVKCNLETGRTHQIRVHLSSIGCNLVGDDIYVKAKKSSVPLPTEIKKYVNTFPRQALHAYSLGFEHPIKHIHLAFTADYPDDMKELMKKLRNI